MKYQKCKKIKRIAAFFLSIAMTAAAVPAFEISAYAEEAENTEIAVQKLDEIENPDAENIFIQAINDYTVNEINAEKIFDNKIEYNSDEPFSLTDKYDNVEKYAADCALWGFIDPITGSKYDFYKAYQQIRFH